jgi:hypothetical protein
MKRSAVLAVALLLGAAGVLPLLAGPLDTSDPNDTKGLLDVRQIHVSPKNPPRFTFLTFRRWSAERIWDSGYLQVHIDSIGDEHFDYFGFVRSDGVKLQGRLYRDRKRKPDYQVGWLKVTRRDQRHITLRIPLEDVKLPEGRPYYRWYATTTFSSDFCRATCIDRVPDTGAVTEETITGSPSPSVTPSPSTT